MMETQPTAVELGSQEQSTSPQEALAWLKATFPNTFFDGRHCKPLKVGIIKDIVAYIEAHPELTVSKTKVRLAVVQYTRQRYYINQLRFDADRVDLSGEPAGTVNEEEGKSAQFKLKRKVKKNNLNGKRRPPMRASGNRRSVPGNANPTIKFRPKRSTTYAASTSTNRDFNTKITLKKNPADLVPS